MFFVVKSFNLMSQNSLSIKGVRENGEIVNINDIFMLGDACTFYVQDNNGEKEELRSSKWQLLCKDNKDNDIIEREISNLSEFTFLLDDLRINASALRREKSDSDSSVYFETYIRCYGSLGTGKVFDLSFPIYLNLLPSLPTCEIINHNIIGYFIAFDITCNSERSEELTFTLVEIDGSRKYTTTTTIRNPPAPHRFSTTTDSEYTVKFRVSSENKYGSVHTEYIEIPMYMYTSINNIESGELISFYPNPFHDSINISGCINQINSLSIYDINGRLVKKIFHPQAPIIHLEEVPSGIYIINVELNNGSGYKKYKLLKK